MNHATTIAAYETSAPERDWYCPTCVHKAPKTEKRLRVVSVEEAEARCNEHANDECAVCGECITGLALQSEARTHV